MTWSPNQRQSVDWLSRFVSILIWLWIPVVGTVMVGSYVGISFTDALSFGVGDGWCDLSNDSLGSHCFGDFGLLYYEGGATDHSSPHFYTPGNYAGTNTPLVAGLFELTNALPYRLLLATVSLLYLSAMACMLLMASRGLEAGLRAAFVVFGGVLSVGMLAAIDRSNHVALVGPLLGLMIITTSSRVRVLCMALLISLKFWGIVFLIILLQQRKFKEAFLATLAAVGVALLGLFLVTQGDFIPGLSNMIASTTDPDYARIVSAHSVSLSGLLRKASCVVGFESLCPTSDMYSSSLVLALSLVILVLLLLIAWKTLSFSSWSDSIRYSPVICLVILGLPEAGIYVLVLVPVLTALLARDRGFPGDEPGWLRCILVMAVTLTTVPIAIAWEINSAGVNFLVRIQYVLVPAVWSLTMAGVALALVQRQRKSLTPRS